MEEKIRDFRPLAHFTPSKGWTNDPNGLIYKDGTWHMFAQHYPLAPHWDKDMCWLHAVSDDLINWKELGIAISPDEELGSIFSGSAVVDEGNRTGLGKNGDPVICMYTAHGEHEQQCIAYSEDCVSFTPYSGNPVIPNTELADFRDPKVFCNPVLDCWSVVIAAGDHVEFYKSEDLIHWEKTGEFGRKENAIDGVFECPDLFPLTGPGGKEYWILVCSMFMDHAFGGNRAQYFIGDFDGLTFRITVPAPAPLMLDEGYDNYAQTTYHGTEDRIMTGWAANPGYAASVPTGVFRGIMTYARKLSLADTRYGLRLAAEPVAPSFALRARKTEPQPQGDSPWPLPPVAEAELQGELFSVKVEAEGPFNLEFLNGNGEVFRVGLDNVGRFTADRTCAGLTGFSPLYDTGMMSVNKTPRLKDGPVTLEVHFDRMIAEIYADEGTFVNTTLVFPRQPYTLVRLTGRGTLWA